MKLLSNHLCIMFHLRMQRKDGDRNVCRFFIRVTGAKLAVFQSLENGTGRTPVLDGFLYSGHTSLLEAWQHQCWDAPSDRLAFHLFLIEIEQQKTWKMARFECLQDRAIWHMSHTGAWWILRFKPYKPNRSLKTSMLRCSKRQSSFSFVFDWNRASENIKNSTFWVPSKTCFLAHVAHRCLMESSIPAIQT